MRISRPPLVRFLSLIAVLAFFGSESQSFWAEPNLWTSIGPDGGGVNLLAIDPQNPRTIYSGTSGGIFKSTDGGKGWKVLSLPGSPAVLAVAIDPMNPGTVYAGTTIGVFKTTDGAASWSPPKMTFPILSIAIAVTSPDTVFVIGVFQGIRALMKSTDGGTLWSAAMEPPITTFAVAIDPQTPGTVYAGTGSGLLKSIDGGANWTLIGSFHAFTVAIDPQDPNTIFAIDSNRGLFKSTNGGVNWIAAGSGLPGDRAACLSIDPQNKGTVYAGTGSGVFKTTNGGSNWSPANSGVRGTFVKSLAIDPQSPATVYVVIQTETLNYVSASVFKSTNGGTSWVQSHSGLTASFVSAMAVDSQFPDILHGVVAGDVVKSTNGGMTWFSVGLPARALSLAIYLQDPRILYAATQRGVFKSSDRGASWTATSYSSFIYSVAIDQQDSNTVYAGTSYSGVLKSTDGGATWNVFDSGLGPGDIFLLTVDPQRSSTVYAIVNGEYDQPPLYRGINKSTDGGIHWTAVNDGLPTEPYDYVFVSTFAIDPNNSATLYAGTPTGVFKSADGGAGWSAVNDGLTDGIGSIAIDPHNPNTIYAGTWRSGVFRSANAGSTWNAVNLGLTTLSVSSLVIDPKDSNRLYAGTSGGGAFAITFVADLVVTELRIDRTSVVAGGSFSVNISGPNLTTQTFFDVRFTSPGSNVSNTVLNWQRGVAASHGVPGGTASGAWTINGVRAHEVEADHTGSFVPVSETITVSP